MGKTNNVVHVAPDLQADLDAAKAKIVLKEGWFWDALHWVVKIATFGGNSTFSTHFITTLGPLIALPAHYEGGHVRGAMEATIRHELVHVRQFRTCGLGSAWVGILPMFLLYVLLPLPIFFAWGRWALERPAYLVNLRYTRDTSGPGALQKKAEGIAERLSGGAYGWALPPFKWVRRYMVKWLLTHI